MKELGLIVFNLLRKPPQYTSLTALSHKLNIKNELSKFQNSHSLYGNQRRVRNERLAFPRMGTNKIIYSKFLQKLYPLGDSVDHGELYNSYSSLPSPQPLHIDSQHFEHLLCQFTNSGGKRRSDIVENLTNIIHDMLECGMKMSLREINTYIYVKNYNQDTPIDEVADDYKLVMDVGQFDISTMNIFLKFGMAVRDASLLSKVLDDISTHGLDFDRMTFEMLIKYCCESGDSNRAIGLIHNFLKNGLVMDTSLINTVVSALVRNEEYEMADEIVEFMFKTTHNNNDHASKINTTYLRRHNNQILQYLDHLQIQKPDSLLYTPTPTLHTFSPLISHYTSVCDFSPIKIFKYLEQMNDLEIEAPNSMYIKIFKSFQEHDIQETDSLKFMLNFLVNERNIRYDSDLFNSIIESFSHQSRYQNTVVNGIESQWMSLKRSLRKLSNKKRHAEIEEFSADAIHKLLTLY